MSINFDISLAGFPASRSAMITGVRQLRYMDKACAFSIAMYSMARQLVTVSCPEETDTAGRSKSQSRNCPEVGPEQVHREDWREPAVLVSMPSVDYSRHLCLAPLPRSLLVSHLIDAPFFPLRVCHSCPPSVSSHIMFGKIVGHGRPASCFCEIYQYRSARLLSLVPFSLPCKIPQSPNVTARLC